MAGKSLLYSKRSMNRYMSHIFASFNHADMKKCFLKDDGTVERDGSLKSSPV